MVKKNPPKKEAPAALGDDSIATNRRLKVVEASSIPGVPSGFRATPGEERARRLTRPAETLRAEIRVALDEVIARKGSYRTELGDVPPEVAQAEALRPRLTALHEALQATEALYTYLRELDEIAYSDAAEFLKEVYDEVMHRSSKNPSLKLTYSHVMRFQEMRREAVSEGIARAREAKKSPGNEGNGPATPA